MHIPTIGRHLFWWAIGFNGFDLRFQPWGVKWFCCDDLRSVFDHRGFLGRGDRFWGRTIEVDIPIVSEYHEHRCICG